MHDVWLPNCTMRCVLCTIGCLMSDPYRGFARRSTHLHAHDFAKSFGFLFHSAVWRQTAKNAITFDLMEGFEISSECVLIFSSLSCNLVMWYELNKKLWNNLLLFPITSHVNRKPTVASMMTYKICLIWRHMKAPYYAEQNWSWKKKGMWYNFFCFTIMWECDKQHNILVKLLLLALKLILCKLSTHEIN